MTGDLSDDELIAVRDILNYLRDHPNAKHTLAGIARGWLLQQRLKEKIEVVEAAVNFLVEQGLLYKISGDQENITYKFNTPKRDEIDALIKKTGIEKIK